MSHTLRHTPSIGINPSAKPSRFEEQRKANRDRKKRGMPAYLAPGPDLRLDSLNPASAKQFLNKGRRSSTSGVQKQGEPLYGAARNLAMEASRDIVFAGPRVQSSRTKGGSPPQTSPSRSGSMHNTMTIAAQYKSVVQQSKQKNSDFERPSPLADSRTTASLQPVAIGSNEVSSQSIHGSCVNEIKHEVEQHVRDALSQETSIRVNQRKSKAKPKSKKQNLPKKSTGVQGTKTEVYVPPSVENVQSTYEEIQIEVEQRVTKAMRKKGRDAKSKSSRTEESFVPPTSLGGSQGDNVVYAPPDPVFSKSSKRVRSRTKSSKDKSGKSDRRRQSKRSSLRDSQPTLPVFHDKHTNSDSIEHGMSVQSSSFEEESLVSTKDPRTKYPLLVGRAGVTFDMPNATIPGFSAVKGKQIGTLPTREINTPLHTESNISQITFLSGEVDVDRESFPSPQSSFQTGVFRVTQGTQESMSPDPHIHEGKELCELVGKTESDATDDVNVDDDLSVLSRHDAGFFNRQDSTSGVVCKDQEARDASQRNRVNNVHTTDNGILAAPNEKTDSVRCRVRAQAMTALPRVSEENLSTKEGGTDESSVTAFVVNESYESPSTHNEVLSSQAIPEDDVEAHTPSDASPSGSAMSAAEIIAQRERDVLARQRPYQNKRLKAHMGRRQKGRLTEYVPSSGSARSSGQKMVSYRGSMEETPYYNFFKMLSFGVPMRAVKTRMWMEGFNPDELDDFQYKRVRFSASAEAPTGWAEVWEGPLAKFYKMLNAGVPVEAVKQHMCSEGENKDSLDVDLFRAVQSQARSSSVNYEEGEDVEPCYQKYFLMLGQGKTMRAVKDALRSDGHEPDYMDQFQFKRVVFSGTGESDEYKVDDSLDDLQSVVEEDQDDDDDDDREYSKFFKMLAVGIPMRAVRQKMLMLGYNPDDLDNFSFRRIRWLTNRPRDEGFHEIWEGDNAGFYKLLNLGVPEEAVRQRMLEEGYDPKTLDVDLFRRVQIQMKKEDFHYEEGKDAGIEYLKYFNMLDEGVVMRTVKEAMRNDGFDPSVLDNYQYARTKE